MNTKQHENTHFAHVQRASYLLASVGLLWSVACGGGEVAAPLDSGVDDGETSEATDIPKATGEESPKECWVDDTVNTQEELRSLDGCVIVHAHISLRTREQGITELSPLSALQVLDGTVAGGGYKMEPFTLEGLENLRSVGELHFAFDNIVTFSGVPNVTEIGSLRLHETPSLKDLRGLENVETIRWLRIYKNASLTSLSALESLTRITGDLDIRANPRLPREEIDALLARITVDGEILRD